MRRHLTGWPARFAPHLLFVIPELLGGPDTLMIGNLRLTVGEDCPLSGEELGMIAGRYKEANGGVVPKAKTVKPDLILMDVVMPGLNGFQATRAISRDPTTRTVPIILCTSKSQETDKIWGLRQGARDYIVKPVKRDELLAKITAFG